MRSLKKTLTFVLILIVSFSGFLFGCRDKYSKMKVTTDLGEEGLTLFLGENDGSDVGSIIFTVNGAGNDISTKLKFSFLDSSEGSLVKILSEEINGVSTKLTLQAVSGGNTVLRALTEEGNKKVDVKISCVKKVTAMKLTPNYTPAIIGTVGNTLALSIPKLFVFEPEDTTQNNVIFSSANIDGVTVDGSGLITIAKDLSISSFEVIATNADNNLITQKITVVVVEPILEDDISFVCSDGKDVVKDCDNKITLVTNSKTESDETVTIITSSQEELITNVILVSKNDSSVVENSYASLHVLSKSQFTLLAHDIGSCRVAVMISFAKYSDIPTIKRFIDVDVIEVPSSVSVNGLSEDFSQTIYDSYNNELGKQFNVIIGSQYAYDKTYAVAVLDQYINDIIVLDANRNEIALATLNEQGTGISGECTVIPSGTNIYIKALESGRTFDIVFYALGSVNHDDVAMLKMKTTLSIGAKSIEPVIEYDYGTWNDLPKNTVFVEDGSQTLVNYAITDDKAACGGLSLSLVDFDNYYKKETDDGGYSIYNKQSGLIVLKAILDGDDLIVEGKRPATVECKLTLPNGVESENFNIAIVKDYDGFNVKVDSPLDNNKIASSTYELSGTLSKVVVALNSNIETRLSNDPIKEYNVLTPITYSSLDCDSNGNSDNSETNNVIAFNDGFIYAKNVGYSKLSITVRYVSFNNGNPVIRNYKRSFIVEVYVPITSVSISKTVIPCLYWQSDLNKEWYDQGLYKKELSITVFPSSLSNTIKDHVSWTVSNDDALYLSNKNGLSVEVGTQYSGDKSTTVASVIATISYYSSVIVKSCIVNLVSPVRVEHLTANLSNNEKYAYFDISSKTQTDSAQNIKIVSNLFSSDWSENVSDSKVLYFTRDSSVARVDEDGTIIPVGAGKTQVRVYAEDNPTAAYQWFDVIVADGLTESSALRIKTSDDLKNINKNWFYYLANNITLSSTFETIFKDDTFGGHLDGKGYTIQIVNLNKDLPYLFDTIGSDGQIKNLQIYASCNDIYDGPISYALLAKENDGKIENVTVNIVNSTITGVTDDSSIEFAGIALLNNGTIKNCFVNMDLSIKAENSPVVVDKLLVAGYATENARDIIGSNSNYEYGYTSSIQSFDATVNFVVDANISVDTNEAIASIAAINSGSIGTSSRGFAVDCYIDAPNINNVGGIAGQDTGYILNSLVYADISGKNNVGGVAGLISDNNSNSNVNLLDADIVELYSNLDGTIGKVSGSANVGGLIGKIEFDSEKVTISNSYVKSYNSGAIVNAQSSTDGVVGGLIGYAKNIIIQSCFSNLNVVGTNVGGLIGKAESVIIKDIYTRGSVSGSTQGSFIAVASDVNISTSYSIIADMGFIGTNVESSPSVIENCLRLSSVSKDDGADGDNDDALKSDSELKEYSTYNQNGFSISDGLGNPSGNVAWFLSSSNANNYNSGYPVLLYNNTFIQEKLEPTMFDVTIKEHDNLDSSRDGVLVLYTNQNYILQDVLNFEISPNISSQILFQVEQDEQSNFTNYGLSKKNGLILKENTGISSLDEKSFDIVFALRSNVSFRKTIRVVFVNEISSFDVRGLGQIRQNETSIISALNGKSSLSNDYILGISSDISSLASIPGAKNVGTELMFNNNSKLETNAVGKSNGTISLYKLIQYNGEDIYIKLASKNYSLEIYNGASAITIDNTQIDMTLIDEVKFTVKVYTDNVDELLTIRSSSDEIYLTNSDEKIKFANTSEAEEENKKLKLTILDLQVNSDSGFMAATFLLKINSKYLASDGTNIIKEGLSLVLTFEASNDVENALAVNVSPQRLLKFDVNHFPAGLRKVDTDGKLVYRPIETPSNTLTPGQVGLLCVDIYPEYAYYDSITVTSSSDDDGNKITFIQCGKYENNGDTLYLELKPNPSIIENGISLIKQSIITKSSDSKNTTSEYATTFNGTFYINTLIGSNVKQNEVFTITITAKYIEDGEEKTLVKNIQVVVYPCPSIALSISDDDLYTSYLVEDKESRKVNLIARGTTIEIDKYYNNFLNNGTEIISLIIEKGSNEDSSKISCDNNNPLKLSVGLVVNTGTVFKISVSVCKVVNGFEETYYSNELEFLVVDFIITDVKINGTNGDYFSAPLYEAAKLSASLVIRKYDEKSDNDLDITNAINKKIEATENLINLKKLINNPGKDPDNKYWYSDGYKLINKSSSNGAHTFNFDTIFIDDGIYIVPNKKTKVKQSIDIELLYNYTLEIIQENDTTKMDLELKFVSSEENASIIEDSTLLDVVSDTDLDRPYPIYTIDEFYNMEEGVDYILMDNLEFGINDSSSTYKPFDLNCASLDGNSKTITINGIDFSNQTGSSAYIGLFTTITDNTVLKNLTIEYYSIVNSSDSSRYPNGLNYSTIYFGGLAAFNYGIISNCFVNYNCDIEIKSSYNSSDINMAGFVSQNTGKITYSIAKASTNLDDTLLAKNKKLSCSGNIAGFVNDNSGLVANCQVEYIGLNNTSAVGSTTITAGFVGLNSSKVYYSGINGDLITSSNLNNNYINRDVGIRQNDEFLIKAIGSNDKRIYPDEKPYFACLTSNNYVAGFVYRNNGTIKDAYSNIPLLTNSRSAGFVFVNSGDISTSYTASYYDGNDTTNTAHTPFVGTNEYGEVQNDPINCEINFCYYIADGQITESDQKFKEPATFISYDDVFVEKFIGFDITGQNSIGNSFKYIWDLKQSASYLPTLYFNRVNEVNHSKYVKNLIEIKPSQNDNGIETNSKQCYANKYPYSVEAPKQISNGLQFLNVFNSTSSNVVEEHLRLINDIDLSDYAGTDLLNRLQKIVFAGSIDGNGMTIDGVRVIGLSENQTASVDTSSASGSNEVSNTNTDNDSNQKTDTYDNCSSSFGFFKQIGYLGSFDKKASIRNLTLKVKEVSKSTSAFTGILAGVIVNSQIKNLEINANGVTVQGRNVTGGLAGAILGESAIYNISVNASVSSGYISYSSTGYTEERPIGLFNNTFKAKSTDICKDADGNPSNNNISYAGAIAGIIDIDITESRQFVSDKNDKFDKEYRSTDYRSTNADVIIASGDISISGEIVGGLFGYMGQNVFLSNSQFVVSSNDSQRLKGLYIDGGLVGINDGGLIYLSKVEVEHSSVNSFDNSLTNQTGNNLFADSGVHPVYIGGLVGVNYGGALSHCYTKTNVINFDAKYAGGLVGYSTMRDGEYVETSDTLKTKKTYYTLNENGEYIEVSSSEVDLTAGTKYYEKRDRYLYITECYTTGNVFAGINYNNKSNENGDVEYKYNSNYSGGVIGKYSWTSNDCIDGLVANNGFHLPNGYIVPTEDNLTNISYSDIASGFKVIVDESKQTEIEYKGSIGAFAGYIELPKELITAESESQSNLRPALFNQFVYDDKSISLKGSGKQIELYQNSLNEGDMSKANSNLFGSSVNKYVISSTTSSDIEVYINQVGTSDSTKEYYDSSKSYFVLRGDQIGYTNLANDDSGVYKDWTGWIFNSPVYPVFKPKNSANYIEISDENGLKKISSGSKYILTHDIYLTEYWEPIDFVRGVLTSALRTKNDMNRDGNLNGSVYYAIYNINIKDQGSSLTNVGFFGSLRSCAISNINFVFGTNIQETNTQKESSFQDGLGFNLSGGNVENAGLLAGDISSGTRISHCNAFVSSLEVNSQKPTYLVKVGKTTISSVGGLIGHSSMNANSAKNGSIVSCLVSNYDGNTPIPEIKVEYSQSNNEDLTPTLYFGGLIGNANSLKELSSDIVSNINLKIINKNNSAVLYFAGLAGSISNISEPHNKIEKVQLELGKDESSGNNTYYVGGVYAKSEFSKLNDIVEDFTFVYNGFNKTDVLVIGGLCGWINGGEIKGDEINGDTYINKFVIKEKENDQTNSITLSSLSVGGAFGKGVKLSVSNCSVQSLDIQFNGLSQEEKSFLNMNVGGFIGSIDNESTLTNAYVCGEISIELNETDLNSVYNFSGFIGGNISAGSDETETDSNYSKIKNCISDVNLSVNTNKSSTPTCSTYIAGFSSENKGKIIFDTCVSLGSISTNFLVERNNEIAGFAVYVTWVNKCYSLCTIKAIGTNTEDELGITPTIFKQFDKKCDPLIKYCYNLNGVMNKNNKNNLIIGNKMSYQDILGGVQPGVRAVVKAVITARGMKNDLKYLYMQDVGFKSGIKINPIEYPNNTNTTSFSANSYVVLTDDLSLSGKINYNLIANDSLTAPTITISGPIKISEGVMVSGVEFSNSKKTIDICEDRSCIISENNGYLFNCVANGNVSSTYRINGPIANESVKITSNASGFIMTNNGVVNACGSNTVISIEQNEKLVYSGFVSENKGLIANSYSVNLYENSISDDTYELCGFVYNNENGYIANSYASANLFKLSNYDNVNNFVSYEKIGTLKNCYYDAGANGKESCGEGENDPNLSYVNLIKKLNEYLGDANYKINFGYPTPLSFTKSSKDYKDLYTESKSSLISGVTDEENNETYAVINIGNLLELFNQSKTNLKLISDFDAGNFNFKDCEGKYYTQKRYSSVTIKNESLHVIYNINLPSSWCGLLCASGKITLSKLGIYGYGDFNDVTQSDCGLLVGYAGNISMENCFAATPRPISVEEKLSFGLLIGNINNSVSREKSEIKNCFADGILKVSSDSGATIGALIGTISQGSVSIENTFANGEISLINGNKEPEFFVGGMVGNNLGSIVYSTNYSSVSIKNYYEDSIHTKDSAFLGAICGKSESADYVFAKYCSNISLIQKPCGNKLDTGSMVDYSTLSFNEKGMAANYNNNIVSEILGIEIDGSKLNPTKLNTISGNMESNEIKYYYVSSNLNIAVSGESIPSIKNSFIVGNSNTELTTKVENATFIFFDITNCVISGFYIKNAALCESLKENSYLFNLTFFGNVTSARDGFGVIAGSVDGAVVVDNCKMGVDSDQELTINSDCKKISVMLGSIGGGNHIIRDSSLVNVKLIVNPTTSEKDVIYISGFSNFTDEYADNAVLTVIDSTINCFSVDTGYNSKGIIYFGGVSAINEIVKTTKGDLLQHSVKLRGSITLGDITCEKSNREIYFGALFGIMDNIGGNDADINILNSCCITGNKMNISFKDNCKSSSIYIGLIAKIYRRNMDLYGFKSNASITIKVGCAKFLCAGGFAGQVTNSTIINLSVEHSINFIVNNSETAGSNYLGGLIGQVNLTGREGPYYSTETYGIYNLSNNNSGITTAEITNACLTYLGGIIGDIEDYYLNDYRDLDVNYLHNNNLVAATWTGDISILPKKNILDARTWTSETEKNQYGLYTSGTKNNEKFKVRIPLFVGGVFGTIGGCVKFSKSDDSSTSDIKNTGSVRALLLNLDSEYSYELKGNYNDNSQFYNNEIIQCAAGGIAGLVASSVTEFSNESDIEVKTDSPIHLDEDLKIQQESYLNVSTNGRAGCYFLKGISKDFACPLDMGSEFIRSAKNESNVDITVCAMNFGQWNVNRTASNKDGATELSKSVYTKDNITKPEIFDNYYGSGGGLGVEIYKKDGDKGGWGSAKKVELTCIYEQNKGSEKNTIFAGFTYGGKTYNRSYWYVPSSTEQERTGTVQAKMYITEHWAGSYVGCVFAD